MCVRAEDSEAGAPTGAQDTDGLTQEADAAHHLTLREEQLRISTEPVQAGALRIRKRVTEWVESIEVPLRREDLVIEVLPGGGAVRIDGRELQAGEMVEIPLVQEHVNIAKETIVSDDVDIRKVQHTVTEHVEQRLKREVLDVDEEGDLEHAEHRILVDGPHVDHRPV